MARDWENIFRSWSSPPGKSEQERCENAEKAIRKAIAASPQLSNRNITVFTQGSYRNNTNVRQDSDIDVGILCYDSFYPNYPKGYGDSDFGIPTESGNYHYSQFKNEIGYALVDYFGSASVKRGNKAFNIKENSYHVDADVAPFFEHRRYDTSGNYDSGIQLFADDGKKIINWPEQHYNNGVSKNINTGKRFKAMARILKSLCNEMVDNGVEKAKSIPGFLNECMIWNVPDSNMGNYSYMNDVRNCFAHLFNNTLSYEKCSEWGEVSELKYLFRSSQKWTWQQAHSFIGSAWNYVGFE